MITKSFSIVVIGLSLMLCGCGSSPQRQQTQLLQLARQADQNYQTGKFDRAREQYEAIVAANPKFVPAHLRLGVIAYRDGDLKQAQARFEVAHRLDPRNPQAQFNLAMLHLNQATLLLNDYVDSSTAPANRQQVRALLAQLQAFGTGE
ncbi:MAG TPA: tetratricopeptide repeat protein [Povalibacter sp.]|uniref:tetratricopeptide repeat protein n=1 Tax=Povalibacter sp. TaxID=1962978 RepID=UPI002B50A648|nr:tetratricopeptide repeat protein [Povalibacter sp.]HMN46350.1 tetratricopeptide repeat protein [Povalibacter sp.]